MATKQQQMPDVLWKIPLDMAQYILQRVAMAPYGECARIMSTLEMQTQQSLEAGTPAAPLRVVGADSAEAPSQ